VPEQIKVWRVQDSPHGNVVTRLYGFRDSPDTEVIAAGFNHAKEYGAIGIGRQGNFLQWGYGDPPARMTEAGRRLFINCIHYIHRFDGKAPLVRRKALDRHGVLSMASNIPCVSEDQKQFNLRSFPASLWEKYRADPEGFAAYYKANLELIYYDRVYRIDEELKSLGFDSNRKVETLERVGSLLKDEKHRDVARRLLTRYIDSPMSLDFRKDRDRLYFSDVGGYKFRVVPEGYLATHNPSVAERSARPATNAETRVAASPFGRHGFYILTPREASLPLFKEIVEIIKPYATGITGRPHEESVYDAVFGGAFQTRPGDVVILLFSLDSADRIPPKYADVLPRPWPEIEKALAQGRPVECEAVRRDLHILLLAAPKWEQLSQVVRESRLLGSFTRQQEAPGASAQRQTGPSSKLPVGPVRYVVTVREDIWSAVQVRCTITTDHPLRLHMDNNGAPSVPGGYRFFVRDFRILSSQDDHAAIQETDDEIRLDTHAPVTFAYEVTLLHDKHELPYGADEAPHLTDRGAFWTGRSLFFVAPMKNIAIHFDLPAGCRVSTPWESLGTDPRAFVAQDEVALGESFVLIGDHAQARVKVRSLDALLAVDRSMEPSLPLLEDTLTNLLTACDGVFGGSPSARSLVVASAHDKKGRFDGGVFGNSVSLLLPEMPTRDNRRQWVPFLAHELVHLWSGQAMKPQTQQDWFTEGFTEYYAYLIAYRQRAVGKEDLIRRIEKAGVAYYENQGTTSILDAGGSSSHNTPLVYNGGFLLALLLDTKIRQVTAGQKRLEDVMQVLYQKFGAQDRKFTENNVIEAVGEVTATDQSAFFREYLARTSELPLEQYLGYIGLRFNKEVIERLPELNYVVHAMLQIPSLSQSANGLVINRPTETLYQPGDVLVAVAGTRVGTFAELQAAAQNFEPGAGVEVTLLRNAERTTIPVVLRGSLPVPRQRKVTVRVMEETTHAAEVGFF
jgi:predicted metalloprotease with PDZ domain